MSMPEKNTLQIQLNPLIVLIGVLIIILTLFLAINYRATQSDISEIKRTSFQKIDSLVSKLSKNDFNFDTTKRVGNKVLIDPLDVQKITSQIKLLIVENQKENYRAESIIDKDYDRLTLYLALGIGFMTLLGIFTPVLVNLITSIDTKSKLVEFKIELEKINKSSELTKKELNQTKTKLGNSIAEIRAITQLAGVTKKELEDLKQTFASAEVKLAHLKIQNAVFRLMNISTMPSLELLQDYQRTYILGQFTTIINGFIEYSNLISFSSIVEDLEMVFNDDFVNMIVRINLKEGDDLAKEVVESLKNYMSGEGDDQIKDITAKLEEFVKFLQKDLPQTI